MSDEIYYVLARVKESEDPYNFVSYKRKKRSDPIDIGLLLRELDDFRLNYKDALEAKTYLERGGYEVILSKHFPGVDGIDLDNIVFEDPLKCGMLERALLKKSK